MITFFVCLLLFFSFSFVKFFSFKMTKKIIIIIKTEHYLKLVQLFFGHNFLFSEGDTPSNSFETFKTSSFWVFPYICSGSILSLVSSIFPFVLWTGMVMLIMSFSNVPKKKERKKIIFSFYINIYVLLAFHVMIHFLCVCLCVWFLSTFQYRTPKKKKWKITIDFFRLYALFS